MKKKNEFVLKRKRRDKKKINKYAKKEEKILILVRTI